MGGPKATAIRSEDRGDTWEVQTEIPMMHGESSTGIFSVDFKNDLDGIMVGGDFRGDELTEKGLNAAVTEDGGKTWSVLPAEKSPGKSSKYQSFPCILSACT